MVKAISVIVVAAIAICGRPAAATPSACLRAIAPTPAGGIPNLRDFEPAACNGKPVRTFRFDAAMRSVRTISAIQRGDIVRIWPDALSDAVGPGDKLSFRVAIGGVIIEREVQALQPASPGEHLFVRDGDGNILSVRYEGALR